MSDICPACNTTMTAVPPEHDGATGYYVCPYCSGDCEHGRQRRKCETCAAWESAIYNQKRVEGAELQLSQTKAMLDRLNEWHGLSDAALRLRCGELSAQEIRAIRAVLGAITGGAGDG